MKIKTNELTGLALDWAVEEALDDHNTPPGGCYGCRFFEERAGCDDIHCICWHDKSYDPYEWPSSAEELYEHCPINALTPEPYSSNWRYGGPIIESKRIQLTPGATLEPWMAMSDDCHTIRFGHRPLIAAMRCYVASKLGDEVEVPEELK